MGKTLERRKFTPTSSDHSLRYRRKVPVSAAKEQQPTDLKPDESKQLKSENAIEPPQQLKHGGSRSEHPPIGSRCRPKSKQKQQQQKQQQQQQPVLLKQLLWKAKVVQPTPLTLTRQNSNCNEEEEAYAKDQHQGHKMLASGVEALGPTKRKTIDVRAHVPTSSESFVAGSSSQETQSGSEDDVVFLQYSDLRPAVHPSTKWRMDKEQQGDAEEIDKEEPTSPVMPSQEVGTKQVGLEKAAAARRKQRQKYRLKKKQKRAAAKKHKRLAHPQKQEKNERVHATEKDTGSTQDGENATTFHPSPNRISGRDTDVGRGVFSHLKEVVLPVIVVGDVPCPVLAASDEECIGAGRASNPSETSTTGSEVAIAACRQHVSAKLDRSKEMHVQPRDSFVVETSGFDAASSYDFFKHRFGKIQQIAGLVYY